MFLIPLFQSPDENRHYDYIAHLAQRGELPVGILATHEVKETFLQETVFLQKQTSFDLVHFTPQAKTAFIFHNDSLWRAVEDYKENKQLSDMTDPESVSVNYYPPLYYGLSAGVYKIVQFFGGNLLIRFYALRALHIVFSVLIFILMWKILVVMNFSLPFRLAFALVFTFWPQLGMYMVGLQPDVLAMLFVTALLYVYLFHIKNGTRYFYLKLGLLFTGLFYVKLHFFVVTVFTTVFLYLLYVYVKDKKIDFKVAYSFIPVIALAAPWLLFNVHHYETLLPPSFTLGGTIDELGFFRRFWYYMSVSKNSTFPTAIAYLGWRDAKMPDLYYTLYYIVIGFCLISFGYFIIRHVVQYGQFLFRKNVKNIRELFLQSFPYYLLYIPFFAFSASIIYIGMKISPYLVDQGRHYFAYFFPALLILLKYGRDGCRLFKGATFYLVFISVFIIVTHVYAFVVVWYRYYVPDFIIS